MATDNRKGGTLRTDYETDRARLEGFPAMESDRNILLHQLIEAGGEIHYREGKQEGTLAPLLENQVLTVIADIVRKKLSGYGGSYAEGHGTTKQDAYAKKLEADIHRWISRLDGYLEHSWRTGNSGSPATETALQLKGQLEASLEKTDATDKPEYFRMLRAVTAIREYAERYLQQAAESGDTEPALALLVACLKNYSSIAVAFNGRLASLPELYRRDILHAVPRKVVQDNAYLVITPSESTDGFTLPEGTAFAAGDELVYKTAQKEYISPVQCAEADAVYLVKNKEGKTTGICRQAVSREDTTAAGTLFTHGEELQVGWQLESPMLVLDEGERNVAIHFLPATDNDIPSESMKKGFALQYATAEGWTEITSECSVSDGCLCFRLTIRQDEAAPTPCTEEMHGMVTDYPAVRILTDNEECPYEWAKDLTFKGVQVEVNVKGIHNFTFYNELGEVDTSQPFSPFGIQAGRGAWFLFGNDEMGLKHLQTVCLTGRWQKLPETEAEFNEIYKEYGADADSFTIDTEYQKDRAWHPCADGGQKLFSFDGNGKFCPAKIAFNFAGLLFSSGNASGKDEYSREKNGFFRATLQSPAIGFGTDAYRKRFTDVMMHNGRCKEKERKPLPPEPAVPLLADVELSYTATEATETTGSSLRLSRITALPGLNPVPIESGKEQPFLPAVPSGHLLYFAFSRAEGEKSVRMYLDTTLPQEKIPFYNPQLGSSLKLSWEWWNGTEWQTLPSESVKAEETNGLTQSGFIEIKLPRKIETSHTDRQGRMWLRAALTGDVSSCLAVRSIRTNCIKVTAQNGDGTPLPAGTIQGLPEADERIESIVQPLPGFGGRPAGTESGTAVHQTARIGNRHRAVTMKDYEQLALEHFPEIDKVQCIPVPRDKGASEIRLVVFSRAEDSRYCLSPAWKLTEIQRLVSRYAPPFVTLRVMNPVYEAVKVHCKVVLWDKVRDEGKTIRQLVVLAQSYIAPWYRKGNIPELQQRFSYKELHARMANHEDLRKVIALEVDGKSPDAETGELIFKGSHPWSVLLPEVQIELLSSRDGIDTAEIGSNFIIG